MSSLRPMMPSNSNLNITEDRWVIQIRQTLDEKLEDDSEIPAVCIFNVPNTLKLSYRDSYNPQQVAIGPYHYCRSDLYEMERYKVAAAKRTKKQLQSLMFQNLVDELTELVPTIRLCYHKYLEFNDETLVWMMVIGASFLLEFLQIYTREEGKVPSTLVDFAGRKSTHDTILRDMVMLENQIPLIILRKTLKLIQFWSQELADDMLHSLLKGLCKDLFPFKMMENLLPKIQVSKCAHLLDFLYQLLVPAKLEEPSEVDESVDQKEATQGRSEICFGKELSGEIWKLVSKLNISFLKKLQESKPVKVILKLPWKQYVECLFPSQDKEEIKPENNNINKPPLVEEITIPSVTELSKSGVRFSPTNGGISTISFDVRTVTFYLPTVSLDGNTVVILRNLVAYEASHASGPLVFTRYTELMNGIVDTVEDAKLLREKRIIFNHLKSDQEVANMWNGMSKSIRLTKVDFLDKVIEDVNKYYNGRWKVKAGKFMKRFVLGSWQCLTLLAAILLLLLTTLQAFCSVYSCSHQLYILEHRGSP